MVIDKYNTVQTSYAAMRRFWQCCQQRWQYWLKRLSIAVIILWLLLSAWIFTTLHINIHLTINDGSTIARRFHSMTHPFATLTADGVDLGQLADTAALRYGIDPQLFRALITQESAWNPDALSSRGAGGLTQLMPMTAKQECNLSFAERFEPEKNLNCGAYYLSKQLKRFGNVQLALCAYNAGPTKVNELGRCPQFRETRDYVSRIMTNWNATLAEGEG